MIQLRIRSAGCVLARLSEEMEGAVGQDFLDGDALVVTAVVGGDNRRRLRIPGFGVHHKLSIRVVHVDVHSKLSARSRNAGDRGGGFPVAHFHLHHVSSLVHEQRRRAA